MNTFSIEEAMKFGWKTTKANFWFFFGVSMIYLVLNMVNSFLDKSTGHDKGLGGLILYILFVAVSAFISMGVIRVMLKLVDGQPVSYSDIFSKSPMFGQFFIAIVVKGLIVAFGTILFVIPGVIASLGLFFAEYIVVDKQVKGIDALKQSWTMTKGLKLNLLLLAFVSVIINILGAMALFIGLLFTWPTTMVAFAYIYRKVSGATPEIVTADLPVITQPSLPVVESTPIV